MPLISKVTKQVKTQIKVEKTGKVYSRSKTYAITICEHDLENLKKKKCKYYLMIGRKWTEVTKKEFDQATSLEAERTRIEQLHQELEEKVKKELGA